MVDLTVSMVVFREYDDAFQAVQSIVEHTTDKITKKIYVYDNSAWHSDKLLDETARAQGELQQEAFREQCETLQDVCFVYSSYNRGFGGGHNAVLKRVVSRYHAVVNPDIILKEDSFGKLIEFWVSSDPKSEEFNWKDFYFDLKLSEFGSFNERERAERLPEEVADKASHIGLLAPRLVSEDGQMLKAYRREPTVWDMFIRMFCPGLFKKRKAWHTMDEMDYTKPFDVPFVQGSFLLFETDLLQVLGGFDTQFFMYMEDADICRRVNEVARVVYCPDTEVIHKWEQGSHKDKELFKIHLESMKKYFRKWKKG